MMDFRETADPTNYPHVPIFQGSHFLNFWLKPLVPLWIPFKEALGCAQQTGLGEVEKTKLV